MAPRTRPIDREVLLGFLEEVRGYLPQIRRSLAGVGAADAERRAAALEEIHRLLHSIKGASSMLGLVALSHVAFAGERAMDDVELLGLPTDEGFVALIEKVVTGIGQSIDDLAAGRTSDPSILAAAITDYRRWRGLPEDGDAAEIAALAPTDPPSSDFEEASDPEFGSQPLPIEVEIESAVDAWLETSTERENVAPPEAGASPSPPSPPSPIDLADLAPPRSFAVSPPRPPLASAPFVTSMDLAGDLASDLLQTFREEAQEHLEEIHRGLRDLAANSEDKAALQQVRRRVHTLKGAASLVGMPELSRLAHRMEDLLDGQVDGVIAENEEVKSLRFTTADALEDLAAGTAPEASLPDLYRRYDLLLGPSAATPSYGGLAPVPVTAPVLDLDPMSQTVAAAAGTAPQRNDPQSSAVRVPIERLDDLSRFASELVVHRSVFERHFTQLTRQVEELVASNERLRNIAQRLDRETEARTHAGTRNPLRNLVGASVGASGPVLGELSGSFEFDALELDRYSEFHLMSRELTETASDLHAVGGELGDSIGDFDAYLNRLGRLTSEVQNGLLRLRMVPLSGLAARLHRAVRVTAEQKGKRVELAIVDSRGARGEGVELDKTVLEAVADPLLHLLRNAVDHGIEPVALRVALGKPAVGRIELRAYYEGTQVVLDVVDDGAGIDPAAVRATAVAMGLVSAEESERLADERLLGILFSSGFSTAAALSEVSGRGVGLDVVKSAAERLEGSVGVESTLGLGSKFSIRLPMTLAVTRVLMVDAGGETYAVPLSAVRRIARIEASEIEALGHEPVLAIEGRVYPVLRLAEAFGRAPAALGERPAVLVLDLGDRSIALVVDGHLQAREVVVKPLGNFLKRVHGILGATLTGDGEVVLIVNPVELGRESFEVRGLGNVSASFSVPDEPRVAARPLDVMVVDDSLSVRRVLTNLLQGVGWNSIAAKDGLEALELLERAEKLPDVVLLDIEMPRMDGYELTATLRGAAAFRDLPIVMLTSRSGEKHRRRAFDLGVTEYLVKPYQEDTLLSVVRRVVRAARESGG